MAQDTLEVNGIPMNPVGMNDNIPLDTNPTWYQTNGLHSLHELCVQRMLGKNLLKKFDSPVLQIHGDLKDRIFIETASTLYLFINGIVDAPVEEVMEDYILIQDRKTAGTNGGTFSGFEIRTLNTIISDMGSHVVSLASNLLTLKAGTYRCHISCPAFQVHRHKARLFKQLPLPVGNLIGDNALPLIGTSEFSSDADSVTTRSVIIGRFTLAVDTTIKIIHVCEVPVTSNGLGVETGSNDSLDEVFTIAEFWRAP